MEHSISGNFKYIEWLSAGEMHAATLLWNSELLFARDEQRFLEDLVKNYTLELTASEIFGKSRELVGEIILSEKEAARIMKKVQSHQNLLRIMVDDVDEKQMEKAYRDTHKELAHTVMGYLEGYRKLKERLFNLLTSVMKKGKQKRLLN